MTKLVIPTRANGADPSYSDTFKSLYYHLYSNSAVSRAERLVEDLSLLLLCKLAVEVNGAGPDFYKFLEGDGTAEDRLLGHLRSAVPDLVDPSARFAINDETARGALLILDAVRVSDAPAHALGEAFQALIGPRLRGERGQFFTPRTLVRAMVEVLAPAPTETVLDPACGTGGFLLEVVNYWQRADDAEAGRLIGVDKDAGLARLAAAVLRIAFSGGAEVFTRNSLDPAATPFEPDSVDVVLTNPPFGAKIGITDARILDAYDFGHRWRERKSSWDREDATLDSQDPQVLFLEASVRALRPGGRLGIVLPEGLFGNRRTGYVWEWLRSRGEIIALLDCPRTTFQPGTDTKTNVLFFRKGPSSTHRSVAIAVAVHCGHDRRGRTTTGNDEPFPDDFQAIADDYMRAPAERIWWHDATISEPYYLVPRFYSPRRPHDDDEIALTAGATRMSLRQLVDAGFLTVRKGVEVGSEAYGTGSIPFVRTSDIANFEIKIDPTNGVDESIYERLPPANRVQAGDVLMVVDGRYRIGATALVALGDARCIVQSHFRILTPAPDEFDSFALLYTLNLPSVKEGIRNLVFVQSTLGTLGARLFSLEIPILRGDGPWAAAVQSFREALTTRSEQLMRLRAAVDWSGEVEL